MSQLIYYPSNKKGDTYKIPDEVKEFPEDVNCGVFNYNQNLKSITINASETYLQIILFRFLNLIMRVGNWRSNIC